MEKIWIIKTGEPLHTDGQDVRLYRMGILASMLSENGYEVTWWTSTVDHVRKKQRFDHNKLVKINNNLEIYHLHSILYKKNVSFSRIVSHRQMAKAFKILSRESTPPDIILCSFPTLEFCVEAVRYGEEFGIPVIIDIRDLWPDIFVDLFPKRFNFLSRFLLSPMFSMATEACRKATAIIGITPEFVQWGLNYAGRNSTELDKSFPLGYMESIPDKDKIAEAKKKWEQVGIGNSKKEFIVCFFGNFGRQFDFETVINAAKMIEKRNKNIKFVLCGSGDQFDHYRSLANGVSNILFPGWVNTNDIWTLMKMSSVGLAPYKSKKDFMLSLPNKIIEYMSSALPIITSLDGRLRKMVTEGNFGIYYKNGDAEALTELLINLYDNRELRVELSDKSFESFQSSYSAEIVYNDLINHMNKVYCNYQAKK